MKIQCKSGCWWDTEDCSHESFCNWAVLSNRYSSLGLRLVRKR